jgi:hypothetical protein
VTFSGTENVFGTLVPEPSGCALISLCLLGLVAPRKRDRVAL